MREYRLPAYAKINLFLRVAGKRSDGYHELDTYFLQINWADYLSFKLSDAPGLKLSCNWSTMPLDERNLCARAYELIAKTTGERLGVELHLEKKIPMGAGLGGGSSDAAVTLVGLNHLLNANLSPQTLFKLAEQLGSDVPFFLHGGLCHGSGRGEILTPLSPLPNFFVLLVVPNFEIATALVYQNLKIGLTTRHEYTIFADLNFDAKQFYPQYPSGRNDLEPWVLQNYPELARIKQRLLEQKAWGACMTGSGSAVFGLFETKEAAQQAQRELQSEYTTHIARPVKCGITELNKLLEAEVFGG